MKICLNCVSPVRLFLFRSRRLASTYTFVIFELYLPSYFVSTCTSSFFELYLSLHSSFDLSLCFQQVVPVSGLSFQVQQNKNNAFRSNPYSCRRYNSQKTMHSGRTHIHAAGTTRKKQCIPVEPAFLLQVQLAKSNTFRSNPPAPATKKCYRIRPRQVIITI